MCRVEKAVTVGHTRNSFAKAGSDPLARGNRRLHSVNAGYPTGKRRRWHALTLKSTDQLGHVLAGGAQCLASSFFSEDSCLEIGETIRFHDSGRRSDSHRNSLRALLV